MGELRLGTAAHLRVPDIARAAGWSERTTYRYVEAWALAEGRADVPRVERRHTGRRGRPAWAVDALSFFRWLRASLSTSNTNAVAND